jgi:NAD(P)-dependent dehydrogenase (short-subunit alcohol dehydrogenase family)
MSQDQAKPARLLEGKRALITGARKGIGRGIALTLAREGAHVGINDIVDDEVTQNTRKLIEAMGVRGSVHAGDVSQVDGIESVVDGFVKTQGGIDILVNNAIFPDQSRPLFDTDEVYWDRMMNLSLKGYFFAAQRAARHMVDADNGGRIVCLSSVHAYDAWKNWTAYGVAKTGLRRMVKGLAVDLHGTGVTANCIAPGAITNSLPDDGHSVDGAPIDMEAAGDFMERVPTQRGGLPTDIANAVLFLTSDMGSYVNGETILVDGGLIAAAE